MIVDLNPSTPYKPLTEETFRAAMYEMYKHTPIDRSFHVLTGAGGMDMFNHQMRVTHLTSILTALIKADRVTSEQVTTLSAMINSPDRENMVVAETIMDNL